MTNECWAAFTERSTRSCTLFGNNTGARCLYCWYFGTNVTTRAIYLVFADLAFSGVKSLSRTPLITTYAIFFFFFPLLFLSFFLARNVTHVFRARKQRKKESRELKKKKNVYMLFLLKVLRCYTVCTHNRIRSPRLAAFGRIETRWVREVGKFGPYLRYKDWLRRRLLVQLLFSRIVFSEIVRRKNSCFPQYFLWELARTRGIRLFN